MPTEISLADKLQQLNQESTQQDVKTAVESIDNKTPALDGDGGSKAHVTNFPSDPATATNQTTGNNSLSSIDGKIPSKGQALASGSMPVVMTAIQAASVDQGVDGTGITPPTGGSGPRGWLSGIYSKLAAVIPSSWLVVGGAAAVGSAPTANPVGVSGVDAAGLKRSILLDADGRARVVGSPVIYTEDFNEALTPAYRKVCTTTTDTKSLRMSANQAATAYDIEYQIVTAGGTPPTADGQALLAGDDFTGGIPIGDIYARSATSQKLIVWRA